MEQKELLLNTLNKIRVNVSRDKLADFVISSVYLYLLKKKFINGGEEEKMACEIAMSANKELASKFDSLLEELDNDSIYELVKIALRTSDIRFDDSSSDELSELVMKLFGDLYGGPIVFDACAGRGTFLLNAIEYSIRKCFVFKDLFGTDINYQNVQICNMLLKTVKYLKKLENSPIVWFSNAMIDDFRIPITHAYVFPPLGLKFAMKERFNVSKLYKDIEFTGRNTAEWLFIDNVLAQDYVITNVRTIAITTLRALFSEDDREYRNRLIKDGKLEGIIELPPGSVPFTNIKLVMLVFSNGNQDVKILDASEFYIRNKKQFRNVLDAKRIYDSYMASNCQRKTFDELVNARNILPSNLQAKEISIKNGVILSELADVFTGSQYTSRNFEDMFSKEPTGYKILTSSDIENGVVDWNKLQSICYEDTKFDKFAVQKGDIVVTSKSSKVKTVVVDIEPKEKILVTGGMIIVRPKTDKLNSTYFKMFIDSKLGQASLKQIQKGSIIITINSKDLATILVPLVNIDEQNKKADDYNLKLITILSYKREIERLEKSLQDSFESDDGGGGK
mgnify:CR=1 FL=1